MNNSTGRLQRLPNEFWMPQNRSLYDKSFYINIWEADVKEGERPTKIETCKDALECVHRIRELNSEKERFAFASGPVNCYGGQHAVFAFTGVKEGVKFLDKQNKHFKAIRMAYNCLFNFTNEFQKIGKTEPEQEKKVCPKGDKTDKVHLFVDCVFDPKWLGTPRDEIEELERCGMRVLYTFKTTTQAIRKEHGTGHLKNGKYEDVWVYESAKPMFESQLPHPIGWYADYLNFILVKNKPNEYEEYEEDMAELQAMKEAFAPACDYVSHEPENIYDSENFDICEDEDELPE